MSKIKIKTILKNKTDIHEFSGKAIKTNNTITYNDNNTLTKITIDDTVSIERKNDYYIKLNFKQTKTIQGTYETKEGNFNIKTETKELNIKKDSIKIKYNLIINNVFIDTFYFNLQYTIDR